MDWNSRERVMVALEHEEPDSVPLFEAWIESEIVEALGGEVWLAPVEEWIYYVNFMGLQKALLKKEKSAIINFLLKKFFQKKIEHRLAGYFKGFLKNKTDQNF